MLTELVALRDGLSALLSLIATLRPHRILVYTGSMQAVHALRRFYRSLSVTTDFHWFVAECPCPVRVC